MKSTVFRHLPIRTLLAALVAAPFLSPDAAADQPPQAHLGEREIFLHGDFHGDGRLHPVVIDRETGLYRAGLRDSEGAPAWNDSRSVGLPEVADASVGRFRDSDADEIIAAHPDANQIALVRPVPGAVEAHPMVLASPRPGPMRLAAGHFDPDAAEAPQQLMLLSAYNPNQIGGGFRLDALEFLEPGSEESPRLEAFAGDNYAGMLKPGILGAARHPEVKGDFGVMTADGSILGWFSAIRPDGDDLETVASLPGSADRRFAAVNAYAAPAPSFLAWRLGESELTHYVWREAEIDSVRYEFVELASCDLEQNIDNIVALESDGDTARILIVFEDGREAAVYSVNDACPQREDGPFLPLGRNRIHGAVPDGNGGFTLFTGTAGGTSTGFRDFERTGDGYELRASGSLPSLDERQRFPNLLAFATHPFLEPGISALDYYRYRDWTLHGESDGTTVTAEAEAFLGETEGLGDPGLEEVGTVPLDGRIHLLPNQVEADISVAPLAPAHSETAESVFVSPTPGEYNRTIQLTFATSIDDADVYYRINDTGDWETYDSGNPPNLFRKSTVAFFARSESDATRITSVKRVDYTFSRDFHEFDANRDRVPDFVRDHYGLDPFGNPDTSGSGATDLEKILTGTDLFDPDAVPDERIDLGAVFDARVYPDFFDPEALPDDEPVDAAGDTPVRAHDLSGNRHARGLVGSAPADPDGIAGALLQRIEPAPGRPFFTASTPTLFETDPEGDDWQGHELVGLFATPRLQTPEIEYAPSGMSLADEVEAWEQAALDAFGEHERATLDWHLSADSTLTAALVEHAVGALLAELSDDAPETRTLFPHRSGDTGRERFTREEIESLTRPAPRVRELEHPLYDLASGLESLRDTIENGEDPAAGAARDFAREVYRTRALHYVPGQSDAPRPLDTFRYFLENDGELPAFFQNHTTWSEAEIDDAHQALLALIDGVFPERELETRLVEIESDTFNEPCRNVSGIENGTTIQLVNARGEAYRFPASLRLPEGTRLDISGFADISVATACQGEPFEVLAVHLILLPTPAGTDDDGNLLPDEWEMLYFGETGNDPFGDASGNGYTNLQHYLEGTDPQSSAPLSDVEPADLSPPTVEIVPNDDGGFDLKWQYPDGYSETIGFRVEKSDDMDEWTPVEPEDESYANGQWEATLPGPGDDGDAPFYRLRMELN